ncbi:unnamed protein product [Adineta ricciae]|nr:unnamed protein product [Adineta ricciae]
MDKATIVYVRLVFLRIGEIDTLNEKYQAHASIESRWFVPADKFTYILSSDDQLRLRKDKSVLLEKYAECCWHPEIYIENSLGDLKEQIKYSAKLGKDPQMIQICEHRVIKGSFWEKLELQHFPSDVQDLSISVTSMFYHDKVILIADPLRLSGVNREAFVDQQEWSLYEHVDTKQRFIREFVFRTYDAVDDDDDDDNEINDQQMKEVSSSEDRKRSILTVTCHAVNRLQVSCTLLLTSITFRWTVNRSLPTISYLTSLDRYGIAGIFNLVFHSLWHSTLSAIIWQTTPDYRVPKHSWIEFLDHTMIIWLYCVPLKYRRRMKQKDVQYRILMQERIRGNINRSLDSENSRPTTTALISIEQL